MASSTRHGGASYTADELADPDLPAVIVKRAELGYVDRQPASPDVPEEVPSSVGNNSNPSTQKPASNDEQQKATPRKPARTTANRSKAPEKETDSDAHTTDGAGQNNESQPSSDDPFDF